MPKKASLKETSSSPFPFVRPFTAPPFFVGIEDVTRQSKMLLDAVQHAAPVDQRAPTKKRRVPKKKTTMSTAKKKKRASTGRK